jgi:hypothetical protein
MAFDGFEPYTPNSNGGVGDLEEYGNSNMLI